MIITSDDDLSSDSDCELERKPDHEIGETDYKVIDSGFDLSLDSDCELKRKLDHEMEMDCTFVSDREKSLGGKIILNGENILENCTIHLDDVKDSNLEIVPDAETETDIDEQSHINISVTEEEFNN